MTSPNAFSMPDAWYDLAGRISAARAVACCALEAVPVTHETNEQANHACSLIVAMQDILKLSAEDVNLIETQLKL